MSQSFQLKHISFDTKLLTWLLIGWWLAASQSEAMFWKFPYEWLFPAPGSWWPVWTVLKFQTWLLIGWQQAASQSEAMFWKVPYYEWLFPAPGSWWPVWTVLKFQTWLLIGWQQAASQSEAMFWKFPYYEWLFPAPGSRWPAWTGFHHHHSQGITHGINTGSPSSSQNHEAPCGTPLYKATTKTSTWSNTKLITGHLHSNLNYILHIKIDRSKLMAYF